jgi:hypothetical protein
MSLLRLMSMRRGYGESQPLTAVPALPFDPALLPPNTDYGDIKVVNGKLVLDVPDVVGTIVGDLAEELADDILNNYAPNYGEF